MEYKGPTEEKKIFKSEKASALRTKGLCLARTDLARLPMGMMLVAELRWELWNMKALVQKLGRQRESRGQKTSSDTNMT